MRIFSRRTFVLSGLNAFAFGGLAYAYNVEPGWIELTRKFLPAARGLSGPLRLAHLADLHFSRDVPLELIEDAITQCIEQKPDFICLTGDYITAGIPAVEPYVRVLRKLSDAAPAFSVTGNHDGGKWSSRHGGYRDSSKVRRLLEAAGIDCLHNRSVALSLRGQKLRIAGVGDMWAGEMDPAAAFCEEACAGNELRILLSHNPDSKDALGAYPWDLMLSGHTHGGQFVIPVLNIAPIVPIKDRRFVSGLKAWNGRWIHITRGVGSALGIRFNCRPEISMLELV